MRPCDARHRPVVIVSLAATLVAASCDRDDMRSGARLKSFANQPGHASLLATDVPPDGTIPHDAGPFDQIPQPPTTLAFLKRGRVSFDTYCAPCHARDGYGDGIIARHGFPQPPSLHDPVVRARDDAHYQRVIAAGLGKMPAYGSTVRPIDRWAIVGYVRALQLSQNAPPSLMPDSPAPPSREGGPSQ